VNTQSAVVIALDQARRAVRSFELGWDDGWDDDEFDDDTPAIPGTSTEQARSILDRLEDRTLTSAALAALQPPGWLIDGLVPAASLTMLYGPSGAGKSHVALDLGASVATGRQWCDRNVTAGTVLYVVAESPAGMGRRIAAWAEHHELTLDQLDDLCWITGAVNLFDPLEAHALAAHVIRLDARLVIIDTLARCSVGAEENSAKDMGQVIAGADLARRAGATVLLVHHTGKDGDRGARGSSALKAAVDAELAVSSDHGKITVTNPKQKDAVEAADITLRLEPHGDSAVLVPASTSPPSTFRPTTLMERVAATLVGIPDGMSQNAIRQQVSGKNSAIDAALAVLVDEEHVVDEPDRRGHRYRLVRPYHAFADPLSDTYRPPLRDLIEAP
jgi:hypothetical protein